MGERGYMILSRCSKRSEHSWRKGSSNDNDAEGDNDADGGGSGKDGGGGGICRGNWPRCEGP